MYIYTHTHTHTHTPHTHPVPRRMRRICAEKNRSRKSRFSSDFFSARDFVSEKKRTWKRRLCIDMLPTISLAKTQQNCAHGNREILALSLECTFVTIDPVLLLFFPLRNMTLWSFAFR